MITARVTNVSPAACQSIPQGYLGSGFHNRVPDLVHVLDLADCEFLFYHASLTQLAGRLADEVRALRGLVSIGPGRDGDPELDERWGELVTAVVEVKDGAEIDPDEIMALCCDRLGPVKTPKSVIFRELPRSAVGEVLKRRLRDEYWTARARAV
jgi:acyl-CoA synthetase (AMP-forming)/AMP-acid ligase II